MMSGYNLILFLKALIPTHIQIKTFWLLKIMRDKTSTLLNVYIDLL